MPTFNAALTGRHRAVRAEFEAHRDLALMTAYFAGNLSQADWIKSKIPDRFDDWLSKMTKPARTTAADRAAAFEALAAAGFDVKVTRRPRNPAPEAP